MFDSPSNNTEPATRIKVADYVEMGRAVVDWARDPNTRPTTVQELARQLDGIAVVPKTVKNIVFLQDDEETLYLRLPAAPVLESTLTDAEEEIAPRAYPLPYFYRDYFEPGFGPIMSKLDTLLARLGDQVAAEFR